MHTRPAMLDVISGAILAGDDVRPLDPSSPEDHLAIIAGAAQAERVGRELLHQAVASARASGHSWAAIGHELGLTRQAVQQRFGAVAEQADSLEYRWLGPVTAFDEMAELQIAGRRGWRTVEAGMLRHKMMRTATQWEHRRVVWRKPAVAFERDGWEVAVRAFPWIYLVRDLGCEPT